MPYRLDDTIAAAASPPGGGARAIVRLSGDDVRRCLADRFRPAESIELAALNGPTAVAGSLLLASGERRLPCELYFWPTARSFTGEPAAEIHTLGSGPLVEAALEALGAAGARPAEPGEFTLRAFLNGRLDLTQAEAVLGAVDAVDGSQLDVALAQLAGGLAGPLGRLRDALLDLAADLEAGLDFADEDLPFIAPDELEAKLAAASQTVAGLAERMQTRHAAAGLLRAVLVGWPNTGKSSLFNALAGRTGALVCSTPGTTRDYLTAEIDLAGPKCLLVDTAGVEEQGIEVTRSGIRMPGDRGAPDPPSATPNPSLRQTAQEASASQAGRADLELFCLDATRPLNAWERSRLAGDVSRRIVVLTKIDAGQGNDYSGPAVATSSRTGRGIELLRERLREAVSTLRASGGEVIAATAVRCRESLRQAAESLERARRIAAAGSGEELVAAELRGALEELGTVVGAVYTDDVLDRVFSRFCIGK